MLPDGCDGFGEAAFDITDKLTLTGGIRFFKADNSLKGFYGYGLGYSSGTGEGACFAGPEIEGSPKSMSGHPMGARLPFSSTMGSGSGGPTWSTLTAPV